MYYFKRTSHFKQGYIYITNVLDPWPVPILDSLGTRLMPGGQMKLKKGSLYVLRKGVNRGISKGGLGMLVAWCLVPSFNPLNVALPNLGTYLIMVVLNMYPKHWLPG